MKVVIDTNCLISCIGKKSRYRNVFDAFLSGNIIFCASSEILLEYEELFIRKWTKEIAGNILALFEVSNNFEYVTV
ncbi:MAG: putative toxin-antitoxin system toxin component, PIN family [Chitinophagaceae bacterium]|nr:putative toxin-antitoxin system toxin component, PIN family [Chitinophagaceae bacterium]